MPFKRNSIALFGRVIPALNTPAGGTIATRTEKSKGKPQRCRYSVVGTVPESVPQKRHRFALEVAEGNGYGRGVYHCPGIAQNRG